MTEYKKIYIHKIKEIFHADWKYGTKILYFTIFISSSLISYYNLSEGFVMSSDSGTFSEWADDLIKLKFNFYSYYSQNTFINPNYIYTIPILLIAFSKLIFGAEWQTAFIIFNLILVFFSLILFSRSLIILKIRPLVVSLAIFFLTLSVDLLIWPRYVLTDTIFAFLVMFSLYLMIQSIIKKKLNYLYFILLMILIYFTRPSSIPFVVAIIFFIIFFKFEIKYTPRLILLFFLILCIFTPFAFGIFYQLMEVYLSNNPRAFFLIDMVKKGMIIHDRPDTWVDNPESYISVVYLYFLRFLYFFSPYAKSFSIIHIILNSLQALIVLFSISMWLFIRERNSSINKTMTLILLIIISVAFFHSFTLTDYDWRYRYPIIMPLLIMFPISFEIFLRKNFYINIKY